MQDLGLSNPLRVRVQPPPLYNGMQPIDARCCVNAQRVNLDCCATHGIHVQPRVQLMPTELLRKVEARWHPRRTAWRRSWPLKPQVEVLKVRRRRLYSKLLRRWLRRNRFPRRSASVPRQNGILRRNGPLLRSGLLRRTSVHRRRLRRSRELRRRLTARSRIGNARRCRTGQGQSDRRLHQRLGPSDRK